MPQVVQVRSLARTAFKVIFPFIFVVLGAAIRLLPPEVPLLFQGLLWMTLLVVAVLVYRSDFRRLCGPVFFYDLIKTSRRGDQIGYRVLFGLLLLALLFVEYHARFSRFGFSSLFQPQQISRAQQELFASSFFSMFFSLQIALVFLFTPIQVAGTLAELKERHQLEFLFVTDLTTREIVLGTLIARLSKLALVLLTGLPIISSIELIGSVDPDLVLLGFALTFILMFALGSISILQSAKARTPMAAILSAYGYSFLLFFVTFSITWCCTAPFAAARMGSVKEWFIFALVVLGTIYGFIGYRNCSSAIAILRKVTLKQLSTATPIVPDSWRRSLPGVAVLDFADENEREVYRNRVRARILAEMIDKLDPVRRKLRLRPPVGADALFWKETYLEHSFSPFYEKGWWAFLTIGCFLLFMVAVSWPSDFSSAYRAQRTYSPTFGEHFYPTLRAFGIILCVAPIILSMLSAAGRVTREREQQTLDTLLTLPTAWDNIVFAKWLGAILSVRWLWLAPVVWYLVGVVLGALDITGFLLLTATLIVYAGFFTSLGLYLSTRYKSTLRASLVAFLYGLLILCGPGLVLVSFGGNRAVENVLEPQSLTEAFVSSGCSPFFTLAEFSYRRAQFFPRLATITSNPGGLLQRSSGEGILNRDAVLIKYVHLIAGVVGLHVFMLGTLVLWLGARANLLKEKGKRPRIKLVKA